MVGWHHQLNGLSLSKLQEIVKDREAWHATIHGVAKSWTQFSNWATTSWSLGKAQFLKDCLYNALHELALNFSPQVYLLPLPINSIVTQTLSFLTWQALFNFWAFTHVTPSTYNIPVTTHCKEMTECSKSTMKATCLGLNPASTIYYLCNFRQVTCLL